MAGYRIDRVSEDIRREIIAIMREIKDPRVSGMLTVVKVDVSNDLSYAKVYVSSFASDDMLEKGVAGLNNAAGFIQSSIAKKLRIRKFPKLTFVVVSGMKDGFRMVQKLNALEEETKAWEAEHPEMQD